jgi:hypothetical protein
MKIKTKTKDSQKLAMNIINNLKNMQWLFTLIINALNVKNRTLEG